MAAAPAELVPSKLSEAEWAAVLAGEVVERRAREGRTIREFWSAAFEASASEVLALFANPCEPHTPEKYTKAQKAVDPAEARQLLEEGNEAQETFAQLASAPCRLSPDNREIYLYSEVGLPFPLRDTWTLTHFRLRDQTGGQRLEMKIVAGGMGAYQGVIDLRPVEGGRTVFASWSELKVKMKVPGFLLDRSESTARERVEKMRARLKGASGGS